MPINSHAPENKSSACVANLISDIKIRRRSIAYGVLYSYPDMGKGVAVKTGKWPAGKIASYITNGKEQTSQDIREDAEVIDTVGAGDAFAAGVLYGILIGDSLDRCNFLGHVAATGCISKLGARGGIPSLEELSSAYQSRFGQPLTKLH